MRKIPFFPLLHWTSQTQPGASEIYVCPGGALYPLDASLNAWGAVLHEIREIMQKHGIFVLGLTKMEGEGVQEPDTVHFGTKRGMPARGEIPGT